MSESIAIGQSEAKITKSGKQYLWVKSVSGKTFSCWDQALWPRLSVGRVVYAEVDVKAGNNGDFYNITGLSDEAPAHNGRVDVGAAVDAAMMRDINIRRQVALKCAVDLYVPVLAQATAEQIVIPIHDLLALADRFVAWLDPTEDEDIPF